ncbi:MAG: hypothetical protein ACPGQS_00275 [Bradymonadia bacterium]
MRNVPAIENAPASELARSTSASRVALASDASGLFLTHFESRFHLDAPETWNAPDRPDLAGTAYWARGQRIEPKYAHFRYDAPLGSFHPSHRSKWTTHELCHGLVGFAWRSNQSRFYHHAAARLSEVVPVALWYFFDEVDVNRCDTHAEKGLLFGELCAQCEIASHTPTHRNPDSSLIHRGVQFVQDEVNAVFHSIESGQMVEHRYQTLNLARDGAAWATAHEGRLNSTLYAWFRELFLTPTQGAFSSLEELAQRVLDVTEHLATGRVLKPWSADRNTWIAHDIADRMLTICAQCEGEAHDQLKTMIVALADAPTERGINHAIEAYESLFDDFYIPPPAECFGVGYQLPKGYGHHHETLMEGIKSACPESTKALGERLKTMTTSFSSQRTAIRRGLALEFAAYSTAHVSAFEASLLAYEAMMAHPLPIDFVTEHFGKVAHSKWRTFLVGDDVSFLSLDYDIHAYLSGLRSLEESQRPKPVNLVMRPTPDQDALVIELSDEDFSVLKTSAAKREIIPGGRLSKESLPALLEFGIIRPSRQLCVDERSIESSSGSN